MTYTLREVAKDRLIVVFFLQSLLAIYPAGVIHHFFSELTHIAVEHNLILVAMGDKRLVDERTLALFEESATHVIDIVEVVDGFKITRGIRVKVSPYGGTGFYEFKVDKEKARGR